MDTVLLKQRDRYSTEVKARYVIDSRVQPRAPFGLRLYFFFPQPFNITPVTYTPQDFFSQLKLNLRFNTPIFTIDELLEPLSDTSPLVRVEKLLHRHRNGLETLQEQALVYEAKILASVYKSILRDFLLQIRTIAKDAPEELSLEKHLQRDVKRPHEVARKFYDLQKTYQIEDLPSDAAAGIAMMLATAIAENDGGSLRSPSGRRFCRKSDSATPYANFATGDTSNAPSLTRSQNESFSTRRESSWTAKTFAPFTSALTAWRTYR